ncbi:MAG: (Fe-S)-binding protein [Desulfobacterales bacterium]|nr:(Fe-S)-binding protein [Desulfobacterales bacterium]
MNLFNFYNEEKKTFLDQCVQCGLCSDECPILCYTDINKIPTQKIQEAVYNCIDVGGFSKIAYIKAFACMECFKCTADICPENLNPMLINELIKGQFHTAGGLSDSFFVDSRQSDSPQRLISSVQISELEYQRITTPTPVKNVEYLFFPGCNVYFQPEKILNALDIMDTIGDEYAFLPGLDNCCGDNHLFYGFQKDGSCIAENLITTFRQYNPVTVVLWCPTCHCRIEKYISSYMDIPFEVVSFPQYLSKKMKKLPLNKAAEKRVVTLHEPCKSAYTGIDVSGPRQVLSQLPGIEVREMEHHGVNTMCCGSGAVCWYPESFEKIQNKRFREAEQTGAKQVVTVCHFCNQSFSAKEANFDFEIVNYVSLVAELLGIFREDKYKTYTQLNDLKLILDDIGSRIESSPFDREKIINALQSTFIKEG